MLTNIVKKGATDQSVGFKAIDSSDGTLEGGVNASTTGLSLWYRRGSTGARTTVSPSDLAGITSTHADGGMILISGGEYRLDLPDAAFASGADILQYGGEATDMIIIGGTIKLVDIDLDDSVSMGLSSLAAITTGTAQGDGGGSNTFQLASGASASDDVYNLSFLRVVGGAGAGQQNLITDYVGSTRTATLLNDWVTAVDNTSLYEVYHWGISAASVTSIAQAVLSRQLGVTVASDGSAPTLEQAIFLLHQLLLDTDISGTTLSIKGLDGTTQIATAALDDASDPRTVHRNG